MIRPAATRLGSNAYTSSRGSEAANGNVVSPSCAPTSIQMRRYVRARANRPNVSLRARRRSLRMNVVTPSQRVDEPVASPILTIFSAPKAFAGHVGIIQENAIRSWLSLKPTPKIILFGDDAGTAGFARGLGVQVVTAVETNSHATPPVSNMFSQADSLAGGDGVAFGSADIILTQRRIEAARIAKQWSPRLPLFAPTP